ncbi:MAG: helix-turn-helix transcriptional regulator [Gammaproteobacteria bacterium]
MPADKKHHTLARQWELLKLLPTRGAGKTAAELTRALSEAGFQVTKRSVERDLNDLLEVFRLDRNDKSPPYGWRWPNDAPAALPGITLAEALSLRLVQETLKPLLPVSMIKALEPRFMQAKAKLSALAERNATARWADKVRSVAPTLPLLAPAIDIDVLETVQEALLANQQLEADYRAMGADEPSAIRLHPLGPVNRGPATYLVATAFAYPDPRLYALHRVSKATKISKPARRPDAFNLDAYIQSGALQFGTGKTLRLEAGVSEGLKRILEETPLSADQKLTRDKQWAARVTATVADSWQLRWWILSQGDAIEVHRPVRLRRKIAASLKAALGCYAET